jgi:hypothetical protein
LYHDLREGAHDLGTIAVLAVHEHLSCGKYYDLYEESVFLGEEIEPCIKGKVF